MPLRHTVEEVMLANSAQGLLIDVPGATTVNYEFNFRGGYLYNDTTPYETPHLLEHLLYGTSEAFPTKAAFQKEITKNAAYLNAFTNLDSITHVGDAASDDWQRVLGLRTMAITSPAIGESTALSEQGNVKEELLRNVTNLERLVAKSTMRALGLPDLLDTERLARLDIQISLKDIEQYYRATHTSGNLRFLIAGDMTVHRQSTLDVVGSWRLPSGKRLSPKSVILPRGRQLVKIAEGSEDGAWVCLGFGVPRRLSYREKVAMSMMMHLLAGGMTSRILAQAREKGICYQMNSWTGTFGSDLTTWFIQMPVSVGNLESLLELIAKEIQRLAGGDISPVELDDEKQFAIGKWQKSGQTTEQLLVLYRGAFVDNDEVVDYQNEREVIDTITVDDLVGLLREFIVGGGSASSITTKNNTTDVEALFDRFHNQLDGVK